jgi:hypothetical protein
MTEKKEILEKYRDHLDGKAGHFSFELLSLYINFHADLSNKERHFFNVHLSACQDCREKFNEVFDTELEIETKSTLYLLEENAEISVSDADQVFKYELQTDPKTHSQFVRPIDKAIQIDLQIKPDQIKLTLRQFPEEFLGRVVRVTLPEVQSSARIISLTDDMEVELPLKVTEKISQITQIVFEFASPIPEAVQESSWFDRIPFGDIPPSRLAAAAVVLIVITAAYFIFYPDRPGPDQPLISQQIGGEAFQKNPLLENFSDRTLRSEAQLTNLIPLNGDTVSTPIHFQWQQPEGKALYTLTIFDNKNQHVWAESTTLKKLIFKETLQPGLYYWKLQVGEKGVVVQKFFIK